MMSASLVWQQVRVNHFLRYEEKIRRGRNMLTFRYAKFEISMGPESSYI